MKQIYLDHNATTSLEQGAQRALLLHSSIASDLQKNFGNASSIHWAGRKAKAVIEDARENIAEVFGISEPEEIFFTSSATESINTALKGFYFHHAKSGKKIRFISSQVEHEATLDSLHFLSDFGALIKLLPVNSQGELQLEDLQNELAKERDAITLVTLMAANNETGVVFPWAEAARIAKEAGAFFHLDAVQAPGKLPGFSLSNAPVDMASFSGHKIGAPKGVGLLWVKRGVKLVSLLHGGAQERKRRAGTMNVASIAAFGAATLALSERDLGAVDRLRLRLEQRVRETIPGVSIQGERAQRLVNTSNFLFEGVRGEALLMGLDLEGFAVSSGSACNSGSISPSHVLLAMGLDSLAAQSAVRVSLSPYNTEEEVDEFVGALQKVIERIRAKTTSDYSRK